MAITKTVSFIGPCVGRTFQNLTKSLVGKDGYLSGASANDDGTNITIGPYAFVQNGIVCAEDGDSTLPVPTSAEPWYVVASTFDDDPATGVVLSVVIDATQVEDAVVLAYKANGIWATPVPITVEGVLSADAPSPGSEAGFQTTPNVVGGSVVGVEIHRGRAVDAHGQRREIAGAVGAEVQSFPAPGPNLLYVRNDHLILRKREAGSEIVHAIGDAIGPGAFVSSSIETGPLVSRPGLYTKRGAGDFRYAIAWGNGTALRLASALNLVALGSSTGVVGPLTVYTGASQIANVAIVGQRASDGALVLVYTEGSSVFLAAFSVADGSIANSPVRIDAQPNACTRVRAALDLDELLHVVYQHNEGGAPPNQQIYYVKCSIDAARFGAPAISPRLANGINSTNNDTWPSIGIDRRRRAHLAYTTGTGANEFGQLRIVVLDSNGVALSRTTVARYGYQPDPSSADGLIDGTPTVANLQRPQVVVTPQDEVSVFFSGQRVAYGQADEVGVYNGAFEDRLGFPLILLSGLFPPSGQGSDTLVALGALSDERGQLHVLANWSKAGVLHGRLDTLLAPLGILGDSYLESVVQPIATYGNTDPELILVPGSAGGLMYGLLNGAGATLGFAPSRTSGRAAAPHSSDVYLSGWQLDAAVSAAPPQSPEAGIQIFHTRPKKMNYPILVGDRGDYQGCGSIEDAVYAANRNGGHIVVRGGSYVAANTLVVKSGVKLEAEGHALLAFGFTGGLQLGTFSGPVACTSVGSVVTLAGGPPLRSSIRPGDLCEFFSATGASTFLTTVRSVLDDTRFVVDGTPTGASALVYGSNIQLSNFSIRCSKATSSLVLAQGLYGARIEAIKPSGFVNAGAAGLRMTYCRESLARDVDLVGVSGPAGAFGIWLDHGSDNVVERAALGGLPGRFLQIDATTQNPRILNCRPASSEAALIQVDPRGATPIWVSGCTARVAGDLENIVTPVGKVVSSPMGPAGKPAGAMQFQDENTVLYQEGVPLDLTAPSAAGTVFNGATPRVLVPSINERLLRAGDTMTGELGLSTLALSEVPDPATPPPGTVRLYLRSNGEVAGQVPPKRRSQLVMLMPDGKLLGLAQTDPV